jgi:uncharacterized MAPEG superfamily protein
MTKLTDRETRQRRIDWAAKNFPGQHPPFVLAALDTLKMGGHNTTRANIEARLRVQGRWHDG